MSKLIVSVHGNGDIYRINDPEDYSDTTYIGRIDGDSDWRPEEGYEDIPEDSLQQAIRESYEEEIDSEGYFLCSVNEDALEFAGILDSVEYQHPNTWRRVEGA